MGKYPRCLKQSEKIFAFTGRSDKPWLHWSRCLPPQSSQNILHSSWRWRSWYGSYWCEETFDTFSAFTSCGTCSLTLNIYIDNFTLFHASFFASYVSFPVEKHCICEFFLTKHMKNNNIHTYEFLPVYIVLYLGLLLHLIKRSIKGQKHVLP